MNAITSKINSKLSRLDIHTKEVLKKSSASTMVKISGMLLALIVSAILGRKLGAEQLGIFNLSLQLASIAMTFSLLGMRQVILKEVAIGYSKHDNEHIGKTMFTAYTVNGIFTLILAISLYFLSPLISEYGFNETRLTIPLSIAFIALLPQILSRIFASAINGIGKIWQSNLADQTLSYLFIIIVFLFMYLLNFNFTLKSVAIIFGISRAFVMIVLGSYWNIIYKYKLTLKFLEKKQIKAAYPLLIVSLALIISTSSSIVILGWFGFTKELGLFTTAYKIAMLTNFFLLITNSALSPKIASLFAQNEKEKLEQMIQHITKGLAIAGIIVVVFFWIFGKFLLSLWGNEFIDAYIILIILSFGQLINIGTGAGGVILMMCGQEKVLRNISLVSLFLNIALNLILITLLGLIGAAIALAIVIAIENIAKLLYVKKYVGISILKFI